MKNVVRLLQRAGYLDKHIIVAFFSKTDYNRVHDQYSINFEDCDLNEIQIRQFFFDLFQILKVSSTDTFDGYVKCVEISNIGKSTEELSKYIVDTLLNSHRYPRRPVGKTVDELAQFLVQEQYLPIAKSVKEECVRRLGIPFDKSSTAVFQMLNQLLGYVV